MQVNFHHITSELTQAANNLDCEFDHMLSSEEDFKTEAMQEVLVDMNEAGITQFYEASINEVVIVTDHLEA